MTDYLREALNIVKAQASIRNMTEDQILSMVQSVAAGIRNAFEGSDGAPAERAAHLPAPDKAIREGSIVCLECGKEYKIITSRHLARHGMTPDQYREKYGYPRSQPLIARSLARDRRKKMQHLRLWERRGAAGKTSDAS